MTPATYTIPEHTSGDTWSGIPSLSITVNEAPPTEELVSVKMQIRKGPAASVQLELSTENDMIVIQDAETWNIVIPKATITLPAFNYVYDIQTVDANGDIKTYIKGTWRILEDITRP